MTLTFDNTPGGENTDYNRVFTAEENFDYVFSAFTEDCKAVARHLLQLNNPSDIFERLKALYQATKDTDYDTVQQSYVTLNGIIAETNSYNMPNSLEAD
jgi:hypothetical protein